MLSFLQPRSDRGKKICRQGAERLTKACSANTSKRYHYGYRAQNLMTESQPVKA